VVGKEVMGVAKVTKEAYPDPTTDDDRWVVVDLVPVKKLENPVTLVQIKGDEKLEGMALIKNSRLSVMPVSKEHYKIIMGKRN